MNQAVIDQLFKPTGYKNLRIVVEGSSFILQRQGRVSGWTYLKKSPQRKRVLEAASNILEG